MSARNVPIWQRLPIIRSVFGMNGDAAGQVSARWQRAFARDPELAADLIRQSGLLAMQPVENVEGYPQVAALDPYRLAYEAGRRDMAQILLAQGHISTYEINQLMENLDV